MNLKEIKLNQNDINLLQYLARFKLMCANDAIYFYGSSYYQKRLQELKNAKFITRYYRIYIKLNPASMRYLEEQGIKCEVPCKNKNYINRLIFVSKLGLEFVKANISFKLSWEMKGNNYTDWNRRFIGEIKLRDDKYLIYYAKSDSKYIRQLHFDINKDLEYQNVLVVVDNLNVIDKQNQFVFPNKVSCILIHRDRINTLGVFNKTCIKDEIERIYGKPAKNSDINLAEYKINDTNIVYMPYIDTHKIVAINNFYSLGMTDSKLKFKTEDGTFGTANWMNKVELTDSFEVGTEDGLIVGKIDGKIVTLPNNTMQNKNVAIFGASGSKKSRGYVIPNILNLAEQGKSMILTDPKGELYKKTYTFLKNKGYNVKILNLVDMDKSDRWNPFSVIENEIDAQIFSEIVIENTQLDKTHGQEETSK
ncbi:MAG: type IV secretory system conjugative DNA transfer family protein [Clostridiales bacterium]|nr:type IV secretory system conjugative DNA transfer family protein [Clostridiales bacterium]